LLATVEMTVGALFQRSPESVEKVDL